MPKSEASALRTVEENYHKRKSAMQRKHHDSNAAGKK